MEGKNAIMSLLLLSLVLGQIQVQGSQICCSSLQAIQTYYTCTLTKIAPIDFCLLSSGCKSISGNTCDPGWISPPLINTGGNAVHEYCKLGCASSLCAPIAALQTSDASEGVKGAIEKCTMTCSAFCTSKGSITAVGTA